MLKPECWKTSILQNITQLSLWKCRFLQNIIQLFTCFKIHILFYSSFTKFANKISSTRYELTARRTKPILHLSHSIQSTSCSFDESTFFRHFAQICCLTWLNCDRMFVSSAAVGFAKVRVEGLRFFRTSNLCCCNVRLFADWPLVSGEIGVLWLAASILSKLFSSLCFSTTCFSCIEPRFSQSCLNICSLSSISVNSFVNVCCFDAVWFFFTNAVPSTNCSDLKLNWFELIWPFHPKRPIGELYRR